jgi:hypothetical protein
LDNLLTLLSLQEQNLQKEIDDETSAFSEGSKEINKDLHIMAAHLHRYKSELGRLGSILFEIMTRRVKMNGFVSRKTADQDIDRGNDSSSVEEPDRERIRIEQLKLQLEAITDFSDEMGRKVQNILTLVWDYLGRG